MNEFWAAIIGAIVGAFAGGGVTAAIQHWQYRREKRDRDRALAQGILFKLLCIHRNLEAYSRHVAECDASAKRHKLTLSWQSLKPIAASPPRVSLTTDEMGFLLSLKRPQLLTQVVDAEPIHNATIDLFELYARRRAALTSVVPAEMRGLIGTIDLSKVDRGLVDPIAAELDDLAAVIRARAAEDARQSWETLTQFAEVAQDSIGHRISLSISPAATGAAE